MAEILSALAGTVVSAPSMADLLREVTLKSGLRLLQLNPINLSSSFSIASPRKQQGQLSHRRDEDALLMVGKGGRLT